MLNNSHNHIKMYENFKKEYTAEDAIFRYSKFTAGYGINYLLENDYAQIYLEAIRSDGFLTSGSQLNLMEFGCGAGMNLITIIKLLKKHGIEINKALGTDFSPPLIASAQNEAKKLLSPEELKHTQFAVAANETLLSNLAASAMVEVGDLMNSFDLIVGVNTFRYCHRLGKTEDCVSDIFKLLRKGGICIIIDMNRMFPLFRSKFKKIVEDPMERYLPTLNEYAEPFYKADFKILKKDNFCWIPHSAGPKIVMLCRVISPFLNITLRRFAMRSLVIAQKPF